MRVRSREDEVLMLDFQTVWHFSQVFQVVKISIPGTSGTPGQTQLTDLKMALTGVTEPDCATFKIPTPSGANIIVLLRPTSNTNYT